MKKLFRRRLSWVVYSGAVFSVFFPFAAFAQVTYEYDALGRLVKTESTFSDKKTTYSYDVMGNRRRAVQASVSAVEFTVSDSSVVEGGQLSFTITKIGATTNTHEVSYTTANGSADFGDYTSISGIASFAPGDTTKSVTVQTIQDNLYEFAETVLLKLSNPTGGAVIVGSQGVGSITNDDPPPAFAINNVTREEGLDFVFTVTKSGLTEVAHDIDYATADGSATAPSDYAAKSGTLSFAPGQISRTITVASVDDSIAEATEFFRVNLSNATNGAVIVESQGTGYITNNDNAPPTANDDGPFFGLSPNQTYTFGVTANDTDPDGDDLVVIAVTTTGGQASISADQKSVIYSCSGCSIVDPLIIYTISDGNGGTDKATVQLYFQTSGEPPP